MISGIILAAGSSQRMGTPKALLKIGETTFLQYIVETLHSSRIIDNVIVLGAEAEEIQKTLSWFDGKVAVNNDWQKGQLTSIITGLNNLDMTKTDPEEIHGVMICPVDHPLLSQAILVDLLQGFWKSKKQIIIPTFNSKRGHPVIFHRELFDEIRKAALDLGARAVVRNHPDKVFEVAVQEPGVVANIDTPENYQHFVLGNP
ncbi:MAG: nucleotidyltransferase family protein [Bacteroidota bacterium]|nr:nucleotidyltransferase family protein [Bacteroidota bacterium]